MLLLLSENLLTMLILNNLIVWLRLRVVDSDWLRLDLLGWRVLACLRVQTERLGQLMLQVRVRWEISSRIEMLLLLLGLLLSKLQSLLEHLNHMVTLLLLINQFFVEYLVD